MQPTVGPWRALRALVVAAAGVGISLFAHACAGGMVLDERVAVAVWALGAIVAYLLSARQWTFVRLLCVLGSAQVLLHPIFEYARGSGMPTRQGMANDLVMAVAHVVATVGLAAVLAHGDGVLWRLFALISALLWPLAQILGCTYPIVTRVPETVRPVRATPDEILLPVRRATGAHGTRAPPAAVVSPTI